MRDQTNFPMSVIEVMLFKLADNGKIAAQKFHKILADTHIIKTNATEPWVTDIELARMETFNSEF